MNQILEATPTAMVIKDRLYLKLRLFFNKDRVRRQLPTGII